MIVSPWCTRRAAAPLTLISPEPRCAGDRVGLKARAVVDVDDVHLLVLEDVGGLQQVGVDRDRADVVQVAIGDGRPVDLRLEHHALHVVDRLSVWVDEQSDRARRSRVEDRVVDQAGRRRRGRRPPAGPARRAASTGSSVSGSTSARYSGSHREAVIAARAALKQRLGGALAARRAVRGRRAARRTARAPARARARPERALRLDIARPSGSRTVGQTSTRTGRFRSRDEPADDDDLLGVLLAEVGDVGLAPCRAAS